MSDSKLRLPKPKLTNHPVDVGQRTEGAILSELVRRGYSVLLPFGVNQRYDLVLDLDGKFVRAQCKTGRLRGGSIEFSPRSTRANRSGVFSRSYHGEVEIFSWCTVRSSTESMLCQWTRLRGLTWRYG